MRNLENKDVLIMGIVIVMLILVPFILYVVGVISKLTMTLLFLIPLTIFIGMYIILKKKKRL